jgi:hypothetical protein
MSLPVLGGLFCLASGLCPLGDSRTLGSSAQVTRLGPYPLSLGSPALSSLNTGHLCRDVDPLLGAQWS